jgi:site-specific DNA-methyltransferase (adenine-specific)
MMKLDQLTINEKNARRISDEHFEMLRHSVANRPWMFEARQIVVRRCDNVVLGGNMRVRALQANGTTEIPDSWVRWVDWTPKQCEDFHVVDNENYGEWIADELLALYGRERLAEMDVDVGSLLDGLTEPEPPPVSGKTDSDEVPDVDESPRSVRGQIYACGEHRLMCADSTVAEDVARLANNCALIVTDPPYGVDYGSQAGTIENDDLPEAEFERFLYACFSAGMRALRPGAAFYVFHADSRRWEFLSAMRRAEMTVRQVLVWVKETFTLGRQDYQWRHEPCIYGWKDGAPHTWRGDRKQSTVIECPKPKRSPDHPTMKPVSIIEYLIRNSSEAGDQVLDLFGGSGTTMIACEQSGRLCRMMEIDPHYCDVIRRRWAEFRHGEGCDWETLTPAT